MDFHQLQYFVAIAESGALRLRQRNFFSLSRR